jgi:enoyl-CoA hydratase/carnithine racemase
MPPTIYEKKGNIAFIAINRPERRNALNFEGFGHPKRDRR